MKAGPSALAALTAVLAFCAGAGAMGQRPEGRAPSGIETPNQGDSRDLGPSLGTAGKRKSRPKPLSPGPHSRDTAPPGAVQEPHAVGAGQVPAPPVGSSAGPGRTSPQGSDSEH